MSENEKFDERVMDLWLILLKMNETFISLKKIENIFNRTPIGYESKTAN